MGENIKPRPILKFFKFLNEKVSKKFGEIEFWPSAEFGSISDRENKTNFNYKRAKFWHEILIQIKGFDIC